MKVDFTLPLNRINLQFITTCLAEKAKKPIPRLDVMWHGLELADDRWDVKVNE